MSLNHINFLLPAILAAFVAILGWQATHWLTRKREISAEKRKMRISYLLEAYRKLEEAGNRGFSPSSEHARNIEKAVADIQLLGTPEQITLAAEFALQFATEKTAAFDPLLYNLRKTLRSELELEVTNTRLIFLRIS